MSFFTKFLIKLGINATAVEAIGGRLVGALTPLNATNAGGYMNPNKIDGFTFNESDGKWYAYPPSPDTGVSGWFDPASASKQGELNQQRYWRELNNKVESASPNNGEAGDLSSPSIIELGRKLPEIIARYREISPEIWRELKDYTKDFIIPLGNPPIIRMSEKFNSAKRAASPLILDLDGDGVETTALSAGLHFDHDANGFMEQTGWVGKDDGLLVLDRNGDGQINSGRELFGNYTLLTSGVSAGNKAANGFAALAELDGNADGKIDASDAAYTQLRVWKDANSDGVTNTGELLSLSVAGVQSLGCNKYQAHANARGLTKNRRNRSPVQCQKHWRRVESELTCRSLGQ